MPRLHKYGFIENLYFFTNHSLKLFLELSGLVNSYLLLIDLYSCRCGLSLLCLVKALQEAVKNEKLLNSILAF